MANERKRGRDRRTGITMNYGNVSIWCERRRRKKVLSCRMEESLCVHEDLLFVILACLST